MFRFCLLIVCCCCTFHVSAQYVYKKQFTYADGLPSNTVNDMLQDDEGFMWFATDEGVSRFDGHHFSNFRKSDGIADDEVIRLGKDHEGRIWFLGFNGKASFYQLGKFYDESNSAVAAQTHLGSALVKFMISKTGTVYLVSNTDGFLQVNGNTVRNYSKYTAQIGRV
jgi:ligand-binding sensor domain-containing protein